MSDELHILILEDRAQDAGLLLAQLEEEGLPAAAKRVWTEAAFLAELSKPALDLILADYSLPGYDGMSALALAQKERPEVPFIFVSGSLGEELAIDTLRHGARDYVLKQRLNRLGPAVRRALREVQLARERAQAEAWECLARQTLERLNRSEAPEETIRAILLAIKQNTGFQAAGIRLRAGEDFPYYASAGFSDEFLRAEHSLCARDTTGALARDQQGRPVLECMCGNILCGRTNPALPFFTPGGSFWTNSTTALLAASSPAERLGPTRNRCAREGFESVALIPLRAGDEIVGLLQLNDPRRGQLTPEMVCFFEGLGASIGIALRRQQADAALRDAESLYHSLVEHLPQCIFRKDQHGRFTYVNSHFCARLGTPAAEVLGKTDFDFYPPELALKYRQDDERVMQTLEVLQVVEVNQLAGQPQTVVQLLKAPVRSASGQILGVQGLFTDITTQKELEAKFLRAQRLESVGSLASGIAHDLNNILAPILMCAPMLRPALPEAERLQMLAIIEQSVQRAVSIIKQLLSFGRGKEDLKKILQLRHLLHEIASIAQETFPRSIQVETEAAADLWVVSANSTQIQQVLLNLCVNARDAMPEGGRLLLRGCNVLLDDHYASMNPQAKPGPYVHIQVSDTGCGIPEAVRPRIFEAFFSTKEADKGTGLGLTTVLGIVKEHGGFLGFTSAPGQGTTFDIHLPAQPDQIPEQELEQLKSLIPRGRQELVLFVDDEPSILHAVERTLSRQGYQVLCAADGVEGLAQFTTHSGQVRAVVTDLMMPLMGGETLCRLLHRLSPQTPVIVATGALAGAQGQTTLQNLAQLGVRHVLQKPHTADALLRLLHEALHPPPPGPKCPPAAPSPASPDPTPPAPGPGTPS